MKRTLLLIATTMFAIVANAQLWEITPFREIIFVATEQNPTYSDHVEMSGEQMSAVIRWKIDQKNFTSCDRSLVFPMMRTISNDTHASLNIHVSTEFAHRVKINGKPLKFEQAVAVWIKESLRFANVWRWGEGKYDVVQITQFIIPSTTEPMLCEVYTVTPHPFYEGSISVEIPGYRHDIWTEAEKGVEGSYIVRTEVIGDGTYSINCDKDETASFYAIYRGIKPKSPEGSMYSESRTFTTDDIENEFYKRGAFFDKVGYNQLRLETPDEVINTEFQFAKIRASESIYRTKGGLMHGPGGEAYYAAIWANDQAEYINPFFPFLGYEVGNESALNSFRHFARFMNKQYKPLPCSIIAEGTDIWNGAGDRGDAAMIASGATRFALAYGDKKTAKELWPLIEWCLEYCHRQLNEAGVPRSDKDELEGRFPAGEANLSTACLYYDGLVSATYLCKELGIPYDIYESRVEALGKAIESYFGAEVSGYKTYRYYDGNTVLRSWICLPLIIGMTERAEGTIAALLSEKLMTENGLLTAEGSTTFWDRSTLYAMRGIYIAGETEKATKFLHDYSVKRLTGEHVPYPIEAWPEGSQRHLSAESGLYCRIFTEGMFGIRPTGFKSFNLTPRLPADWDEMTLHNIKAFGSDFDIEVSRTNKKLKVKIVSAKKTILERSIAPDETIRVDLP